jgi:hypothetical protein
VTRAAELLPTADQDAITALILADVADERRWTELSRAFI